MTNDTYEDIEFYENAILIGLRAVRLTFIYMIIGISLCQPAVIIKLQRMPNPLVYIILLRIIHPGFATELCIAIS